MEFCDCSLEEQLKTAEKRRQPLPMSHIKHFARQIFNGLSHMHRKGVSHRDLKPENILLKFKEGTTRNAAAAPQTDPLAAEVKICDLGSAKVLDRVDHMNTPYVVSRYYRSPELIMGSHFYDCSIDIWAMGCILFELLTRTPLFPGDTEGIQLLE